MGPSRYSVWDRDLPASKIPCNLLAELLRFQKSDERVGKRTVQDTSLRPLLTRIFSLSRISPAYDSQRNRRNTGSMTEKGFYLALVLDFTSFYGFLSWVFSSMESLKLQQRI
jgi:hypothetical protein